MQGIIMQGPSVLSTLAGNKTQTRRVIKEQPPQGWDKVEYVNKGKEVWFSNPENRHACWTVKIPHPVGAVRYVKETYWACDPLFFDSDYNHNCTMPDGRTCYVGYDASMHSDAVRCAIDYGCQKKVPLFMPQWASRLHIKITGVRVEQVQDIAEDDVMDEGCYESRIDVTSNHPITWGNDSLSLITEFKNYSMDGLCWFDTPKEAYKYYFIQINGAKAWESNPWVFVYDYEVVWIKQ